jgi:hypothetical protein
MGTDDDQPFGRRPGHGAQLSSPVSATPKEFQLVTTPARLVDPIRRRLLQAIALATSAAVAACGGGGGGSPVISATTRTWRMGFAPTPPRLDAATLLHGVDLWSTRAELAILHEELPWTDLLAGMTPDAIIDRDKAALVAYLKARGLGLVFMADLTDGLSRGQDAPQLRAAGASLTDPAVRQLYRDWVLAFVRRFQPEYVGLGAETNLIRVAAPAALYSAAVTASNAAAADLRAAGATARQFISVQVETAWGLLGGTGTWVGIDRDRADFPTIEALGLSSYPYFAYARPEDLPANYYQRVLAGVALPAFVAEGGWTSASVGAVVSSPDAQARYVERHAELLDSISAIALFQLLYADLDLASLPPPIPANLPLFADLGLTDSQFAPKPALAAWDALHARPLH